MNEISYFKNFQQVRNVYMIKLKLILYKYNYLYKYEINNKLFDMEFRYGVTVDSIDINLKL